MDELKFTNLLLCEEGCGKLKDIDFILLAYQNIARIIIQQTKYKKKKFGNSI